MKTTAPLKVGDNYVLPTGQADAARLDLIQVVFGPVSVKGLDAANIASARRAADIGCGTGNMARAIALRMAADAHVDAIDISDDQVKVARTTPAAAGSASIHYAVGSAYESGLPSESYDVVFCRLVLLHLKEAQKAVDHMASLLEPGGKLVLVDMDVQSMFTTPPSEHLKTFLTVNAILHQENIGVNYAIGRKLNEMVIAAGLQTTFMASEQPCHNAGPEKFIWEKTFRNAQPYVKAAGTVTPVSGEVLMDHLAKHLDRPEVWMIGANMYAVVGQKPG
jgi:ubiquinone/menaquinone biosynthesis C-methylase UbiE